MHKRANVTLKTVAETAGCSIAVASTVLNGSRGNTKVSDPMRRKILGLAAELGYHPNSASQMLKTRRSTTLGIYVQPKSWRSLSNDYEMAIFRGVEQAARDRNYNLLVLNISSRNLPDICAEKIAESRIDGVILIHSDANAEWVDRLLRVSSNVVAIDQPADQFGLSRIVFDNRAAVELAAAKLAELGHRRILQVDQQITIRGARQSLHHNLWSIGQYMRSHYDGIEVNDESFLLDVPQFGLPHHAVRDGLLHFKELWNYSLIICPLSIYWGVASALADRGVKVPEEMSILTVGDRLEAEFYRPRPTIFCESLRETAFKVFDLLRRCEQSEDLPPQTVKIPFELVDGETLGAAPAMPETEERKKNVAETF